MEEWLAQLEMEMNKDPITMNHHHDHHDHHDHDKSDQRMEIGAEAFDEELAAVLGGEFSSDPVLSVSDESNASNHASPGGGQLDLDYTFLDFHSLSPDDINAISSNNPPHDHHHHHNWESNNSMNPLHLGMGARAPPQVLVQQHHQSSSSSDSAVLVAAGGDDQKKMSKKARGGATSTNTKRKREPNQVQDHIMAERKRRELLSTQFISLSSILPGLKKTDKTSVLGEAIKYMKQLQDKVKALEEATAKRTVESVVVVKKSQLLVADDTTEGDNEAYSSSLDDSEESLPEIEVKVSDKSMLIKIYCQKHKGILPKLFQELENHHLSVVNSSVIPFGTLALDITIHAQLDRELNANVKDVIQSLGTAVSPPGP